MFSSFRRAANQLLPPPTPTSTLVLLWHHKDLIFRIVHFTTEFLRAGKRSCWVTSAHLNLTWLTRNRDDYSVECCPTPLHLRSSTETIQTIDSFLPRSLPLLSRVNSASHTGDVVTRWLSVTVLTDHQATIGGLCRQQQQQGQSVAHAAGHRGPVFVPGRRP